MTNEWTQAMNTAIDAVRNETIEALKRDARELGFFVDTEEMVAKYTEYFIKGLRHAIVDVKTKMCKDIDETIDEWLADGW